MPRAFATQVNSRMVQPITVRALRAGAVQSPSGPGFDQATPVLIPLSSAGENETPTSFSQRQSMYGLASWALQRGSQCRPDSSAHSSPVAVERSPANRSGGVKAQHLDRVLVRETTDGGALAEERDDSHVSEAHSDGSTRYHGIKNSTDGAELAPGIPTILPLDSQDSDESPDLVPPRPMPRQTPQVETLDANLLREDVSGLSGGPMITVSRDDSVVDAIGRANAGLPQPPSILDHNSHSSATPPSNELLVEQADAPKPRSEIPETVSRETPGSRPGETSRNPTFAHPPRPSAIFSVEWPEDGQRDGRGVSGNQEAKEDEEFSVLDGPLANSLTASPLASSLRALDARRLQRLRTSPNETGNEAGAPPRMTDLTGLKGPRDPREPRAPRAPRAPRDLRASRDVPSPAVYRAKTSKFVTAPSVTEVARREAGRNVTIGGPRPRRSMYAVKDPRAQTIQQANPGRPPTPQRGQQTSSVRATQAPSRRHSTQQPAAPNPPLAATARPESEGGSEVAALVAETHVLQTQCVNEMKQMQSLLYTALSGLAKTQERPILVQIGGLGDALQTGKNGTAETNTRHIKYAERLSFDPDEPLKDIYAEPPKAERPPGAASARRQRGVRFASAAPEPLSDAAESFDQSLYSSGVTPHGDLVQDALRGLESKLHKSVFGDLEYPALRLPSRPPGSAGLLEATGGAAKRTKTETRQKMPQRAPLATLPTPRGTNSASERKRGEQGPEGGNTKTQNQSRGKTELRSLPNLPAPDPTPDGPDPELVSLNSRVRGLEALISGI